MDRRSFLFGLVGGAAVGAVGGFGMSFMISPFRNSPVADATPGDGIWTWFTDPRAISVAGYPAVGAITSVGDLVVHHVDASPSVVDLRGSLFQVDDHAAPSLLKRSSDNRILAFASAHAGAGLYTYLSTNPDDVTAFGAETNIDASLGRDAYTYTVPIQLTDEANDPIYLFFRAQDAGTAHYYYSVSTDQGATWAAATKLLSNNGANIVHAPYVKAVQNGNDRIDFFCTDGHPDTNSTNSIYHFYYEGGNFKKTDGTNLTLPITPATHLSKVYDGATTRAWIWDCAVDGSGNPACVYATFPSPTDHRYRYAIWNGASWTDNEIIPAGSFLYTAQAYYSGGVTVDPANVNVVFAAVEVDGIYQIFRFTTTNSGASWSASQLTEGTQDALRPTVVRGQLSQPRLAYFTGTYTSYTDYNTSVILTDSSGSLPPSTGNRIPAGDMDSGGDSRIPAGDMNSGSDKRAFQET
jgi:hypothetical protein